VKILKAYMEVVLIKDRLTAKGSYVNSNRITNIFSSKAFLFIQQIFGVDEWLSIKGN